MRLFTKSGRFVADACLQTQALSSQPSVSCNAFAGSEASGRVIKIAIDKRSREREKRKGMRKVLLAAFCLLLAGCAAKKHPVAATTPPIRSQLPPPTAELIEHCVVVKQENANTVTCSCLLLTTVIDSKTGHTKLVCKKMKAEK